MLQAGSAALLCWKRKFTDVLYIFILSLHFYVFGFYFFDTFQFDFRSVPLKRAAVTQQSNFSLEIINLQS